MMLLGVSALGDIPRRRGSLPTVLIFALAIYFVEGFLHCEDKMFFEPEVVDKALHDFYKNTKGPTNWPPNYRPQWDAKVPCSWDGNERGHPPPVGTRCVNGGYHPLPPRGDGGLLFLEHLSGFAEGPVPPEFQAFQMTDFIGLAWNKLSGSVWNTSYHCFLHRLDLSHNAFSGTLGADFMIRNINHGEIINLSFNQLEGTVPDSIDDIKPLAALLLQHNRFSGPLPDFSHLANLRHLNVAHNKLSGTIGDWLQHMKNLAWMELDYNDFEGTLPTLPRSISRVSASFTKFKGTIPTSYGEMGFLRYFNCTGCDITCPRPDLLAHLSYSSHCKPAHSKQWE